MPIGQMFIVGGEALIAVDSADFDGTNDYMTRGGALTNIADSKSGIFSAWIRIDGGDGTQRIVASTDNSTFILFLQTNNKFEFFCRNAASTIIMQFNSTTAYAASATWLHVLASWDLAVAGSGRLYVNDVSDYTETTYTDDTINYDGATDWSIGASTIGGNKTSACLSEYYFAPGQDSDFSVIANRRNFISIGGKPVYLGADGSVPTGTAPTVYQRVADGAAVATFATNLGTGGDFSITGTLETGSTSPSD